jgi:transcription initiation factor TFIIIB Brf1 subunit/transcription initiation factor TFIIB
MKRAAQISAIVFAFNFISEICLSAAVPTSVELFESCLRSFRNLLISHGTARHQAGMAAASLIISLRKLNVARTIQEICHAANLHTKEVGKYVMELSQSLRQTMSRAEAVSLAPPESTVAPMIARFCSVLKLSPNVEGLAVHVSGVLLAKLVSSQRNPASIAAAALYMCCQAEVCESVFILL